MKCFYAGLKFVVLLSLFSFISNYTSGQRLQGYTNYSNASVASYLMYVPTSYSQDTKNYPILIYLHGDSEMTKGGGANPYAMLSNGLPMVINNGKDIPMIMAAPQGIWAWDNTAKDLDAFIEFLKTKYRINTDQIFLTGVSAGGKGVFQYVDVYKTKIRAIVPISTWPEPTNPLNFLNVPVWSFMGSSDTFGGLYNWIASLKLLGGDATLTLYAGAHTPTLWNSIYDGSRGVDIYTWLLTRGSGGGPPVNLAPVANAGPDQIITLPVSQLQLTGSATDADGTIKSVVWTKVSGPSATLNNATTSTLTLTGLQAGVYTFQFTATDNGGSTGSDQVVVTVKAANVAPVANAGADLTATLPLAQLSIVGSGTDSDGAIASYAWTKISGPSVTLANASSGTLTLSGILAGVYTFQLSVTDNNGATGTDQVMVTINAAPAPNVPPVVNAGSDISTKLPLAQLIINGSAADADGSIVSLQWTQVSGTAVTLANATTSSLLLTNIVAGTFVFQLTAKDNSGATASDQVNVTVSPAGINTAPVVNAGGVVQAVLPQAQVIINGSATDDGRIVSYQWTQLTGLAISLTNSNTASVTLNNPLAGMYTFRLTATDDGGLSSSDVVSVSIIRAGNTFPVVNAGADVQVTLPVPQVTLKATAYDAEGSIAAYLWTQISGPAATLSGSTSTTLVVTNLTAGVYVFKFNARDNDYANAWDFVTLTATAKPNSPPIVNAGEDLQVTLPQAQITITGSASDAEGSIASMLWTKISGPAATLSNTATNKLLVSNILAGTYVFQFEARDNDGVTVADQMTLTVLPVVVTVTPREFDVNITWPYNLQGGTWNDFVTTGGGVVGNSMTLTDVTKKTSNITLSVASPFQDGVNNHGYVPGIYPNNVLMYYLRSTTTKVGVLKLSGLDPALQYDLSILASNVDVWYASDTKFTIGTQSTTVNGKSNTTSLAKFTNLSPDASGVLLLTVAPATNVSTNNGIINAFILTEHGAGGGGRVETIETVATAADENDHQEYLTAYPNPTEGEFTAEVNAFGADPQTYSFTLRDSRGVAVFERQQTSPEDKSRTSIRIAADQLPQGMYILTVASSGGRVAHVKVVKR